MAKQKEIKPSEEAAYLLAALIRLQTGSQSEAVLELHRSGFGLTRIAELLGTTKGTVNVAVQRAKRAKSKGKKK
jgi:DNA-directed RNA polymerase specialized sigma24 family protein